MLSLQQEIFIALKAKYKGIIHNISINLTYYGRNRR